MSKMPMDRSSQNTRSVDVLWDLSQLSLEDYDNFAYGSDACRQFGKAPRGGGDGSAKKCRMPGIAKEEARQAASLYAAKLRECLDETLHGAGGEDDELELAYGSALRLKVAAWQSTFPDYLPAPEEIGDICLHAVSERPRPHSSDYIAQLTEEELASVPKHARGRLTLAENNALVDAFNEALSNKYRLLAMPKSQLRRALWTKAAVYRQQETNETKHRRFLTEDDLAANGGPGFASRSAIVCFALLLRHCGRIREIRGPGRIVRYTVI